MNRPLPLTHRNSHTSTTPTPFTIKHLPLQISAGGGVVIASLGSGAAGAVAGGGVTDGGIKRDLPNGEIPLAKRPSLSTEPTLGLQTTQSAAVPLAPSNSVGGPLAAAAAAAAAAVNPSGQGGAMTEMKALAVVSVQEVMKQLMAQQAKQAQQQAEEPLGAIGE